MWFRTLLDSLKPNRPQTPARPTRRGIPRRRPVARPLAVETLEERLVPASLRVSDVMLLEGNAGTQNAVVMVSLSSPSTKTVTVNYSTANETASAGSDYQAVSGKLTFARGETSKSILIPVIGDSLGEANETFSVELRNADRATIADRRGVVTLMDDDTHISISDLSPTEGNSGTTPFTFTVSLSGASGATVTVNYATVNGTAAAGSDYQANSGSLTFDPGQTSRTVTVLVNGDRLGEANETFSVNLSSPSNAVILDGEGVGTIVDDEPRIISFHDVSGPEGHSGTTPWTFTVNLSAASDAPVTVDFATQDGTAIAGQDYLAASGTLTFAPGKTSKTITVQVIGNDVVEGDDTFFVNLSGATNALIADGQAVGTIEDDEPRTISFNYDLWSTEGNGDWGATYFTFTVSLSAASKAPVTVNFATQDGTAIAGEDYLAASGTLTFAPGETSKMITVEVSGDTMFEDDETFFVNLGGATNALIADGEGVGTIVNEDGRIINWDGGGGDFNWNNPINWDTDSLPGPFDDVVIGADFSGITVNADSETTWVRSVSSEASLVLSGASFMLGAGSLINADLTVSGGYLLAGGLTVAGQFTNDGSVTLDASITVYGNYTQTANGSLTVQTAYWGWGGVSLDIGGTAQLDGTLSVFAYYPSYYSVLTFGSRSGEFAAIHLDSWYVSGTYYYEGNGLWVAFEEIIYEPPPPPEEPPLDDPYLYDTYSDCCSCWYEPVYGGGYAGPGPGACDGGW
jgi:hypothetical protein